MTSPSVQDEAYEGSVDLPAPPQSTELMICNRTLARMKRLHCDAWPSGSAASDATPDAVAMMLARIAELRAAGIADEVTVGAADAGQTE
jgi:hypothetical protein